MINLDTPTLTPIKRAIIKPHDGMFPEPINFICVYWGTKYPKEYVHKLRNSILRNIDLNLVKPTFWCVSNEQFDGWHQYTPIHNWEGWWQKVQLFNVTMPTGRNIYFDLDVVITGSLMDIINSRTEEPIVMIENFSINRAQSAHNSSCMIWNTHDLRSRKIYEEFNSGHVTNFLHGDQCWIWRVLKDHITNFNKDLIVSYKYHCKDKNLPKNARVVVFHGKPDPHEVRDGWVKQCWI